MTFYILFYFIFVCIIIISQILKTNNFIFEKTIMLLLLLISAFRFDVGYDYATYFRTILYFKNNLSYMKIYEDFELFNQILISISNSLYLPQFYFIVSSLLIILPIYIVLQRKSSNVALSLLLFYTFPLFYFNSMSIIRQFIAISILFYSFNEICKKKILKQLLFAIIAGMFHKSAYLIFPILIIQDKYLFKRKMLYVVLFSSFFLSKVFELIIKNIIPFYYSYISASVGTGGGKVQYFLILISILVLLSYNKIVQTKLDKKNIQLFILGCIIYIALTPFGHAGMRASSYFLLYLLLIIPKFSKISNGKSIIVNTIMMFCFLLLLIITLSLGINTGKLPGKKDPQIPYKIFIFNHQRSDEGLKL